MSEIRLWQAYFKTEYERNEKMDWYLAQIAMAIDRSQSTKKRSWKIRDYLLKFKTASSKPASPEFMKQQLMMWVKGLAGRKRKKK